MTLIILACLPVLVFVGGMAFMWLNLHRARVTAEEARAAVRIGDSLSEAIRSSSEGVGTARFLQCYQALCLDPAESVLASRTGSGFGVLAADGSPAAFETVEDWRRHLPQLDRAGCNRVKVIFCGRPWMTFVIELDGSQRVSGIGPLTVSAD